jgi:serine phosphatase RsbU (regulator of sigma subunit)
MTTKAEVIAKIALFASLPKAEIDWIAQSSLEFEVPKYEFLFREGSRDDHFYILVEGKVEIIKALGTEGERLLGVRGKGSFLGEMSLFSREGLHTASVRARSPLKLLQMTREDFDTLLHRQPGLAYELVRLLSDRLDESENITINDLLEKNRLITTAYRELKAAQSLIIEKEKLEYELEIARKIQASFMPNVMPAHPQFDFGALMIPAQWVGGDFYDLIALDDHRFGIAVGDVSDKGVPAALFMALTYSLLRAEAVRDDTLTRTLLAVNRLLLEINATDMFVTVLFGILDCERCIFDYVRAGHPQPIFLDDLGQQISLDTSLGQPLGLFEDPVFDEKHIPLIAGGMLLIFSDGLSEATDENGDYYVDHLQEKLAPIWDQPAQKICSTLWDSVSNFNVPSFQQDDFTLICVKCGT